MTEQPQKSLPSFSSLAPPLDHFFHWRPLQHFLNCGSRPHTGVSLRDFETSTLRPLPLVAIVLVIPIYFCYLVLHQSPMLSFRVFALQIYYWAFIFTIDFFVIEFSHLQLIIWEKKFICYCFPPLCPPPLLLCLAYDIDPVPRLFLSWLSLMDIFFPALPIPFLLVGCVCHAPPFIFFSSPHVCPLVMLSSLPCSPHPLIILHLAQ